jgi:hypothetical protein
MLNWTVALSLLGVAAIGMAAAEPARAEERVFELRTYHCFPGKLEALHKRFREHTNTIFVKHGMSLIGYWTPTEGELAGKTLIYMLAYPSMAAREASWKAFRDDPDWQKAREESEKDGKIVEKVDSVYLSPTDYSPMH